jgi:hypothetical protein
MTKFTESTNTPDDYYFAGLENGLLTMQPFCACGNSLDDDYFCEKCRKTCRCRLIVCEDSEALAMAKRYVQKSSRFSGFRVKLAGER